MITSTERRTIENTVDREYMRSLKKYGNWSDYNYFKMFWQIFKELFELLWAIIRRDYYGPHGVIVEAGQVSATLSKLMVQVLRRELK